MRQIAPKIGLGLLSTHFRERQNLALADKWWGMFM